jgi:hypothetical protein
MFYVLQLVERCKSEFTENECDLFTDIHSLKYKFQTRMFVNFKATAIELQKFPLQLSLYEAHTGLLHKSTDITAIRSILEERLT